MRTTPLVLLLFAVLGTVESGAQTPRRGFLFKDSRADIATARAKGEKDALLVIASMPGANARVAKLIAAAGGTVQFRDDDVDYLRARIPLDRIDSLARHADVHSVNISSPIQLPPATRIDTTTFATDTAKKRDWPPPFLSTYPITNRYDPLSDLRAVEFRRANPAYDGRGVTLAMIDMSMDPLLPELQVAYSLDGKPVPKVVGYETVIDPAEEEEGRWLRMKDTVVAASGKLTYKERAYTAPRDGKFRIDLLDESRFDSLSTLFDRVVGRNPLNKDLNRDGNPPGSSRLFAVLWDERTDEVWVDTNQNLSFGDEKALTDFTVRPEFGVFGRDDPKTAVRESIGFGIQIDRQKKMVALNIGTAGHATLVVGAAVASRGKAGRFDGVAPGAQLVNVAEGCMAYGQTEAVIRAFKNPKVDIVWLEHCANITRPYTLRDGRLTTTVIYDRLIAKYRKILMSPTHNYPVLGGTDDFVLARGAIGVGGHESKQNFFTNHGVRVRHDDNLLVTGGYGPMGNGGFGPDIISPSNYISTARGWEETQPMAELYRLPPGYTIAGGTSTATPTAAGAVALLVSAARQAGIKHDPDRIKHAVVSSARYVPNLPAYKQGSGVINVAGAWEVLKAMDQLPPPPRIVVRAPVVHPFSGALVTPNEGEGLYERGGWTAGQTGTRAITFTRTSGPTEPMSFRVAWLGDDGKTYSSTETIALPLNEAVPLTITVSPKTAGAHTALLTLTHPGVPGFAHRMLATIVVGEPLNEANKYTIEAKTEVPRPEIRSFFYTVPAGVSALRVDVDQPKRDVGVTIVKPDTRTANAMKTGTIVTGVLGGPGRAPRVTYVVTDPMPGVWEVTLADVDDTRAYDRMQAESDQPVPPTPVTLTVSAIAVGTSAPATVGLGSSATSTDQISFTSRLAGFKGSVTGFPLGAVRRDHVTIGPRQQREYTVDVPEGSTMLMVRATNANADVDLYVFDCTGEQPCRGAQTDSDPEGDEIVAVPSPAAGKWKVVIDAPGDGGSFQYLDAVFNPTFGTVSTTDIAKDRKPGEQWTTRLQVWKAAEPPAGRELYPLAALQGQSPAGVFLLQYLDLSKP